MGTLREVDWNCDVCGENRPDRFISVASHLHRDGNGVEVESLVNYCNDKDECTRLAHLRSHRDLAYSKLQSDFKELQFRYLRRRDVMPWLAFFAFIGGFLIRGAI